MRFTEFPRSETLDVRSGNPSENEMNSTKNVIENHIRRFREGNIKGVLDDFSPDAILLTPTGVLKGTEKSQMSAVPNRLQEDSAVFDVRFWRSYRMLRFIVCLLLGGPEHANKAVENCWHTQLLAVLRALNTKVSFGVGYSEPSLMKHWLFFATARKRPNRMSCTNRFL